MSGTGVALALTRLWGVFDRADLVDVEVFNGGPAKDPSVSFLCVRFDESDQPAVVVQRSTPDAGLSQDFEDADVVSTLSMWRGTDTDTPLYEVALAALDTLIAALRADHTLSGAAVKAEVTDYDLDDDELALGDHVTVRFTTRIQLWK